MGQQVADTQASLAAQVRSEALTSTGSDIDATTDRIAAQVFPLVEQDALVGAGAGR